MAEGASLFMAYGFARRLLVISDAAPDGFDVHGHPDEVDAINTLVAELLTGTSKSGTSTTGTSTTGTSKTNVYF